MPAFNHPKLKYAINRLLLELEHEQLDELQEELQLEELELDEEELLLDEATRVLRFSLVAISVISVSM